MPSNARIWRQSAASVVTVQWNREKDRSGLVGNLEAPTAPVLDRELAFQLFNVISDRISDLVDMGDFEPIIVDDDLSPVSQSKEEAHRIGPLDCSKVPRAQGRSANLHSFPSRRSSG